MRKMNLPIAHAVDEGLRAVLRPQVWVVKLAGVPNDLVHELREADGVGGGAGAAGLEGAGSRVGDVGAVVGAVDVHAVPARRERDGRADPAVAHRRRQRRCVLSRAGRAAERHLVHR